LTTGYDGLGKRLFATWYDILNAGVEGRVIPFRRETAGVTSGSVLEIGGGTGANLPYYPDDVRLTFLEPNPHMVRKLQGNADRQGREVTIVPGFGESMPFDDGTFDCVLTTLVLCMVTDVGAVVREARRVLKPGGRFLFYEHVVSSHRWASRWQTWANPPWRFFTTGCNLDRDIAGDIERAGFENVDYRQFSLSVGVPIKIPNIVGVATRDKAS
jgi:SAM-dependent methyltransferase|tara:strand:- start:4852 stop:5493 length:642 start_codon:yes stop_codon:yes gene_type:complete